MPELRKLHFVKSPDKTALSTAQTRVKFHTSDFPFSLQSLQEEECSSYN